MQAVCAEPMTVYLCGKVMDNMIKLSSPLVDDTVPDDEASN